MTGPRRAAIGLGALVVLVAISVTLGEDAPGPPSVVDESAAPGAVPTREMKLASLGGSGADAPAALVDEDTAVVPRQLLIRFDNGVAARMTELTRNEIDVELVRRVGPDGLELVRLTGPAGVEETRRLAERMPYIAYSEPNFVFRATGSMPRDPLFTSLWGLENSGRGGVADADIDATEAWDVTAGSGEVTVGVVDSGVAYDHPDLAGNMWTNAAEERGRPGADDDGNGLVDDVAGWDWVDDDAVPTDAMGHGTHVAGTIGAVGDNGHGISGVNWDVSLMALRVMDAEGRGNTADIAAAFHYAARNGARVVNASLGGPGRSQALLDVMAASPNTLFVAAAGNSASNNDVTPTYPCNYPLPNVICVAATDPTDALASYSNRGALSVHIAAPGTRILSTVPEFDDVFVEDFEGGLGESWTGGSGWGLVTASSGSYLSDSPSGPYADGADNHITTAHDLDLSAYSECRLSYSMRIAAQPPNDGALIEASRDGVGWTRLSGWSGSTEGNWVHSSDDLSEFAGSETVRLRFRFVSDGATVMEGADVDNLRVRCLSPTFSNDTFAFYSGTSMATPHVAGAAALLWSEVPSAEVAEIKTALLAGADPLPSLATATTTGARLNLFGALALVADATPTPRSPSPSTSPAPTDESPTPTVSPTGAEREQPEPTPTPAQPSAVTLTLDLRRHLIARGTVAGEGCVESVSVRIFKKGRVVGRAVTDAQGRYKTRLSDRAGTYMAATTGTTDCAEAWSNASRHRH